MVAGAVLTVKDNILWSQRIQKEKINANSKPSGGFSVRGAIGVPDVPSNFKPGHIDPSSKDICQPFDPEKVGWDPQGTMTREFRRCMNSKVAGPRERHQFPETCGQEIGWIQARMGDVATRAAPMGSKPDKGIGWVANDGHGGLLAAAGEAHSKSAAKAAAREMAARSKPRPRKSKDGNVREELGVPPFATFVPSSPSSRVDKAKGKHAKASKDDALRISKQSGFTQDSKRSASLPSLTNEDPSRRLVRQEDALNKAMERSRPYLNRQGDNKWYRPLSNSDVATFADNYTKAWGVQLYAPGS